MLLVPTITVVTQDSSIVAFGRSLERISNEFDGAHCTTAAYHKKRPFSAVALSALSAGAAIAAAAAMAMGFTQWPPD